MSQKQSIRRINEAIGFKIRTIIKGLEPFRNARRTNCGHFSMKPWKEVWKHVLKKHMEQLESKVTHIRHTITKAIEQACPLRAPLPGINVHGETQLWTDGGKRAKKSNMHPSLATLNVI